MAAGDVYERVAGAWVLRSTLSVGRAEQWLSGTGDPTSAIGVDGDWYLDTTSISTPPVAVTSLPGSPQDGQEVYYIADSTNGILWHLRYRSGATGSYKWEYLGGSPIMAEVVTSEVRNTNTFGDITTVGPSITIPLAGDYDVTIEAEGFENTAGGQAAMSYAIGGTAASTADEARITTASSYFSRLERTRRKTALAASTVLQAKYLGSSNFGQFRSRVIKATPVRVG